MDPPWYVPLSKHVALPAWHVILVHPTISFPKIRHLSENHGLVGDWHMSGTKKNLGEVFMPEGNPPLPQIPQQAPGSSGGPNVSGVAQGISDSWLVTGVSNLPLYMISQL